MLLLSAFGSCLSTQASASEQRLPLPRGMVSDFAGKLSPATKRQIETLLLNFRNRTGIEVAVVTIPFSDMQGYPIEEYALRLGRLWGVGRDSQKRALLLLVAIKPASAQGVYSGGTRLEVSRHLEGDIPDILAAELIRKMRDGFVAGRFDQALTTGTQTILATLAERLAVSIEGIDPGQAARQPVVQPASVSGASKAENLVLRDIILGMVLMFIAGLIFYAISRRLRGADSGELIGLFNTGSSDSSSRSSSPHSSSTYPEVRGHPDAPISLFGNDGHSDPSSWSSSPDSSTASSGWGGFLGSGFSGGGGSDFGGGGGGGDFGGGGASDSW